LRRLEQSLKGELRGRRRKVPEREAEARRKEHGSLIVGVGGWRVRELDHLKQRPLGSVGGSADRSPDS
jgi:hypothetical protein